MQRAIDAIYENGAFRPVRRESLALSEGQLVRITVDDGDPETLRLATRVFEGLSDDEIDEIEKIAMDRSRFFGSRSAE